MGKKAIPLAIAFTLFAGLQAAPAFADMHEKTLKQTQQRIELKGAASQAVDHLRDAYSELAKAHVNVVAGKMKDADSSLKTARDKLNDAAKVRNAPDPIRTVAQNMSRQISEIQASLGSNDLKTNASETEQAVRNMARDMTALANLRGGGGGPQDQLQRQEMQKEHEQENKNILDRDKNPQTR